MSSQETFDFLNKNYDTVIIDNGVESVVTLEGIYNVTTFDDYITVKKNDN